MSSATNELARRIARKVRGVLTDEQYVDLLREIEDGLEFMRPGGDHALLYRIREALGFSKLHGLSHLDSDAKQVRAALLACAPIARAAIAEEKKDEIGNSDLDDEQPLTLHVRTTLGVIRKARSALHSAWASLTQDKR